MLKIVPILCAGVIASGCTVSPKPLSINDLNELKVSRMSDLTRDQEPISGTVSLYEAMARAIKYNLDYKVEIFEEALRASESDLSNMSLLPDLVMTAGLSNRDNYRGSRSSTIESDAIGDPSDSFTTSSERGVVDSSLKLSWDILDFGLSYVRAKQSADQILIAKERKRKVINRVIANVRTAYWRAVSAERLVIRLKALESDITKALSSSEDSYKNRKTAPLAALTYQRELLEIQQQIQSMNGDLSLAKKQLAALMNVSPATNYKLKLPDRGEKLFQLKLDADALVNRALVDRPELRELSYEQRINKLAANSALLEFLPRLSLFGGFNYNDNKFLYNNEWSDWGAQASWNIFDAFKYPAKKKTVEVNGQYLDQRALALTMAVITQVHVGTSQFRVAKDKLVSNKKFNTVNRNILEQVLVRHKAKKASFQTLVREQMNSIVADAKYDLAYADLQNSYADIYAAIGQDVYGNINPARMSVAGLADHLSTYWAVITQK